MRFPAYPKYKDTGVQWLGEVPSHWRIDRFKWSTSECRNGIWGSEAQGDENDIPCIRVADFDRNQLKVSDEIPTIRSVSTSERQGRIVQSGDLLLEKSGGGESQPVGFVALYGGVVDAVCSNFVARMTLSQDQDASYWRYVHHAAYSVRLNTRSIKQTSGIQNLDQQQYLDELAPFPSHDEQQAIANFLDHETAKIDVLVAEQQRLIDLLKEKRQAVISQAVTKGLDLDVPMKPSGIPWLGDIPEHWEVVQSRRLFSVRKEKAIDSARQVTASQKYGIIYQDDFIAREGRQVVKTILGAHTLCRVKPNDFVISLRSFQGGIEWSQIEGAITFHYVVLTPIKFVYEPYFAHLFKSIVYIHALRSTTNLIRDGQDLRFSHFIQVDLPIVPEDEQKAIASFLNERVSHIDSLCEEAERTISLLQERRTALISAAVTGKIDVRNATPENASVSKPKPYTPGFARQLLAGEILYRFHNHPTMGRVKLQKLLHLCEYHGQLEEVKASYRRDAAGPFDNKLMIGVASGLKKQKWFESVRKDGRTVYAPMEKAGQHQKYLSRWEKQMTRIEEILTLLGQAKTQQCEIVSTLYAAWNDLLIEGKSPSDVEIIREASDPIRWHKNKAKIPSEKWSSAISWMREKDIVPQGFGIHTKRGNA
ncbi:MAG: restriction endonuclease subunit S [Planctomycetota bacterium]